MSDGGRNVIRGKFRGHNKKRLDEWRRGNARRGNAGPSLSLNLCVKWAGCWGSLEYAVWASFLVGPGPYTKDYHFFWFVYINKMAVSGSSIEANSRLHFGEKNMISG